jgi:flagellar hook-associated protein FlgK
LDTAQRSADASIVGAVDETNSLATEISQLNVAIGQANGAGADAQSLKDQQNEAVNKLAKLIDVSVMQRQDGGVDVTFGAGHPLVIGEVTYALAAIPTETKPTASEMREP